MGDRPPAFLLTTGKVPGGDPPVGQQPMENNNDMLSACRIAGKLSTVENIANMSLETREVDIGGTQR